MKTHQLIAVAKGIKARNYKALTELWKELQKPQLFDGMHKHYTPTDEDSQTRLPDESKKVQYKVSDLLGRVIKLESEALDTVASLDSSNQQATADIVVDGEVLVENVAVATLLSLEKRMTDLTAVIKAIPTLDTSEDWREDPNSGLFRTDAVETNRLVKVPKVLVKYEATDKHPAQTEIYNETIIDGVWKTVKMSGAMPAPKKAVLVERVSKLSDAVKVAREKANQQEVEKRQIGQDIVGWLLA